MRTSLIVLAMLASITVFLPPLAKVPKVAAPHIPNVFSGWLFGGNQASFGAIDSLPKAPADSLPFYSLTAPEIQDRIAQWKRYQEQLTQEFAKAQGKIEVYQEMLTQLKRPALKDTAITPKKRK